MLTARAEAQSRIEGLAIGADDYLGKPFEPKELSLRIASILRRAGASGRSRLLKRSASAISTSTSRAASSSAAKSSIRLTDRERYMLRRLGCASRARPYHDRRLPVRAARRRTGCRRADQSAAPQDRARFRQSALRADRSRHRLSAGDCAMTTLDSRHCGIAYERHGAALFCNAMS